MPGTNGDEEENACEPSKDEAMNTREEVEEDKNETPHDVDVVDICIDVDDVTEIQDNVEQTNDNENNNTKEETVKTDNDDDKDDDDDDACLEDVEDVWDGEDPSEVEVEKFCLPSEGSILEELNSHLRKKKLIVYPLKLVDLGHPTFIECIEKCSNFKTNFLQSSEAIPDGSSLWTGLVEMTFKSTFFATEAIDSLKSIRDDIVVKQQELDESSSKKITDKWINETANVCSVVPRHVRNMLVLRRLTKNVQMLHLKELFPSALDIVIPRESLKSQSSDWNPGGYAYLFFNCQEDLDEAVGKYSEEGLVVDGVKLKQIPYQPPHFPYGLIKMKRRYKILFQIKELRNLLNNQQRPLNEASKYKINTILEQCKSTINKDNTAREKATLPLHTLSYLRRIPAIRNSVALTSDWMPQISFKTDDNEEATSQKIDNKRKNKKNRNRGGRRDQALSKAARRDSSPRQGSFNPIARVHEIAAKIAKITSSMGIKQSGNEQPEKDKGGKFSSSNQAPSASKEVEGNGKRMRPPEKQQDGSAKEGMEGPSSKMMKTLDETTNNAKRLSSGPPKPPSVQKTTPTHGWNRNQPNRSNVKNFPRGMPDQCNQDYNQYTQGTNNVRPEQTSGTGHPLPTMMRPNMGPMPSFNTANYTNQDNYNQSYQGPPGSNYYNYPSNYNASYSYPGFGYPPNTWGQDQNSPMGWNTQQNTTSYWPNSS